MAELLKAAGVLVLLGAAGAVVVQVWRAGRQWFIDVRHFIDDWGGIPDRDGVPGRAGVMHRIDQIETDIRSLAELTAEIRAEVRPNGGASLWDRIARIDRHMNGESQ